MTRMASPARLDDPARLDTLRQSGLLDTPPTEAFDRLTRLVTRALHVPIALVSLVAGDHQFFKSGAGLPEPWASARRSPLTHSFCRHVVASGRPLLVDDARGHVLVGDSRAITEMNVVAYAGVPLVTSGGFALGALCAIDVGPRAWTDSEVGVLHDLAGCVMSEIELLAIGRQALLNEQERERLVARVERERRRVQQVLRRFRPACSPPVHPARRGDRPGERPS